MVWIFLRTERSHKVCAMIKRNKYIFMDSRKLIGGLLAVGVIGVAIGMLLAPRSGEKTRGLLSKGSRKMVDGVSESVDETIQSLKKNFHSGVDELVKNGKELIGSAMDRTGK